MISVDCKINPREFRRAFDRFAATSRKSKRQVLRQQAKLFVRDVVKVTPPNKDASFNKPGGESTVRADLAKIFRPSRNGISDPGPIHQKYRRRRGRVTAKLNQITGDKRIPVASLIAYRKRILGRVGILASGWNAAARKLGQPMPAWITRHGTRYGRCVIRIGATSMSIAVVNSVRFAGDVNGLERRVQWALDNRARQMDKQMDDYAVKQAARAAGLA